MPQNKFIEDLVNSVPQYNDSEEGYALHKEAVQNAVEKAYNQGKQDELDLVKKTIKNSRTTEEQFGIGAREETARNQVLVDLSINNLKESK